MSTVSFYDNYAPPVKAGEYTITVSQSLVADAGNVPATPQEPLSQKFIVRGPRFTIDPSDVQRAFPPANASGVYDRFLPMIVLNSRTLPWEREMELTGLAVDTSLYPWVALQVFDPAELLTPGGGEPPPAGSQRAPTKAAAMSLQEVRQPPSGTLGPALTLEDDEDPAQIRCNAIEMAAATFEGLVGSVEDLRLLAHVREVTTEDKETSLASQTWFSTVVANRFALAPPAGGATRANVVHLVSLEGFETYLGAGAPSLPAATERVRMISLYAWTFTALPEPAEDFEQLALNLVSPQSDGGSGLLLRVPPPTWTVAAQPDAGSATAVAIERVRNGFAALSYRTQSGGETFAWYRGPFSPVSVTEFMGNAPPGSAANPSAPTSASDALVYDQVNGLFDTSYAVAFETGRSLALASLPFATALLEYRRTLHALLDQVLELMSAPVLGAKLQADGILDADGSLTPSGIGDLGTLLQAGVTPSALVDVLAQALASGIAAQVGRSGGFGPPGERKPSGPPGPQPSGIPAELSALMQEPTVASLLLELAGLQSGAPGSFQAAILPQEIVAWLARTALLHGVPFANLVPDERMLPVESIRFFYLDRNWIDALLDGALSVGIQSSRDSLLQQILRDPLHDAVDAALSEVRGALRPVPAGTPPPLGTMAGFVLRSALVEGWPGLEVRAWSSADSAAAEPMRPLRLDRVAPGVMIAIFPDVPVKVELNEPSEGLVFGVEDEGIAVRYLPGTTGETGANEGQLVLDSDGTPIYLEPSAITGLRRPGHPDLEPGPIQIAGANGLAARLQRLLPGQPPALGPAALAVEMVKVPEQMLFEPMTGSR